MKKNKEQSKGQLAQIARRKNTTKIKPSGKIYKRSNKIDDEQIIFNRMPSNTKFTFITK